MAHAKRTDWRRLTKGERSSRIRRALKSRANRRITGKLLAEHYFRNITRGGLIVHCWRAGIVLPNSRGRPRKKRGACIKPRRR